MVLEVSFSTALEIPHFFCEPNQKLHFACSDTFLNNVINIATALLWVGPLPGILCPYSKIVSSIHVISSAKGKYKVFSSFVFHLSVVINLLHNAGNVP
jgi:olfactory receptor